MIASAAALGALGALLAVVTVLGGFASTRLHGGYREATRELREAERRLDPEQPADPVSTRRLEDELRWLAEVDAAPRDARWRESVALMAMLCGLSILLGIWALTEGPRVLDALAVVTIVVATVLVTGLLGYDGRRTSASLHAAAARSPLWAVRRLERALAGVHRANGAARDAHLAWLATLSADYPLAGLAARARWRRFTGAQARKARAVAELRAAGRAEATVDRLASARVRPPEGYLLGLRGLLPLVTELDPTDAGTVPGDDALLAAAADLLQAKRLDLERRTRWTSALAAGVELSSVPRAGESAAAWALEVATTDHDRSLRALRLPDLPAADQLPDAVAVEPRRAQTWKGALDLALTEDRRPTLLATVLSRWAYALVAGHPQEKPPVALEPAVSASVELVAGMSNGSANSFLEVIRRNLRQIGASREQMVRLVPPPRPAPPAPGGTTGGSPSGTSAARTADAPPAGATAAGSPAVPSPRASGAKAVPSLRAPGATAAPPPRIPGAPRPDAG